MIDPRLIRAWLHARSLARGLPLPVADSGGWRVDTGSADEVSRTVFAGHDHGLTGLGRSIYTPRVLLKLAGPGADLMAHLPPRWTLASESWVMTAGMTAAASPVATVPPGYRVTTAASASVIVASILDADGAVAGSGRAARHDGVFIYDQIVIAAAHRRRGLGRGLMAALGSHRREGEAQILTATADGRALYTTLGWAVASPWATAVILG